MVVENREGGEETLMDLPEQTQIERTNQIIGPGKKSKVDYSDEVVTDGFFFVSTLPCFFPPR